MQLADCTVKHGANHYHAVRRYRLSPAHIQVIQGIHGQDAVGDVVYAGEGEQTAVEEKKRLQALYGNKEETLAVVDKLFPGAKPSMPETLAEIGFDVDCSAEPKKVVREGELIRPPRRVLKAAGEAALA